MTSIDWYRVDSSDTILSSLIGYAGDYVEDYDMMSILSEFKNELYSNLPDGIYAWGECFHWDSNIYDDESMTITLQNYVHGIDLASMFQRHDRTVNSN